MLFLHIHFFAGINFHSIACEELQHSIYLIKFFWYIPNVSTASIQKCISSWTNYLVIKIHFNFMQRPVNRNKRHNRERSSFMDMRISQYWDITNESLPFYFLFSLRLLLSGTFVIGMSNYLSMNEGWIDYILFAISRVFNALSCFLSISFLGNY